MDPKTQFIKAAKDFMDSCLDQDLNVLAEVLNALSEAGLETVQPPVDMMDPTIN